jgi:pimeloyl-ACP methyl ester carboxylesterase
LLREISVIDAPPVEVDFLEAGSSGPVVMLVHSSASGARQWRRLMDDLRDQFRVRAINLFGYGKTPAWPGATAQSLDDQADLVEAALPENTGEVFLVGHSFGACVAMKAAARLAGRVSRLVLLEANPFSLLAQAGRAEAFAEAIALRDCIKTFGARGEWATAAERFADYWGGAGSWQTMTLEQWAARLPHATLAIYDPRTVLPVREIAAILRQSCRAWIYQELPGAGHMAPLTRPDMINPLVSSFLTA